MKWDFDAILTRAEAEAGSLETEQAIEAFRIKYLGKKGIVSEMFASLPSVSPEEKPLVGKRANELRQRVARIIEEQKAGVKLKHKQREAGAIDVTLPGICHELGHKHVLTQTVEEICGIFEKLGFVVQEGPEIETEFNNFTALNIPVDHPSRDAFDTFYLDAEDPNNKGRYLLLRSHTSPGQIRIMKQYKPPFAVIIPGKVFRPDAVDASHSYMFHQIEGLLVDEDVKFSDLKGLLSGFCRQLFGGNIKMRFRPHFFPFTEPSAEVDISWAQGKKGWLEIMGCGIVHPRVFEAAGYPKGKYTGLAFGLGVERIAMLKYGVPDIRLFFENDMRFLRQF